MARLYFVFVQLFTLLALVLGTSPMPADLGTANDTDVFPRAKRAQNQVITLCTNEDFGDFLEGMFLIAEDVLANAVNDLDLLIRMFKDRHSGELLDSKLKQEGRAWDEQNVFASYNFIVHRLMADHKTKQQWIEAFDAILYTHSVALAMRNRLQQYNLGRIPPSSPTLLIHCDESEWLSQKDDRGLNYTQAYPDKTNPVQREGGPEYILAALTAPHSAAPFTKRFFSFKKFCATQPREHVRLIDGVVVPCSPGWAAHVTNSHPEVFDERLTFCPSFHAEYMNRDRINVMDGLDIAQLHVQRGLFPNDYQKRALATLKRNRYGLGWLGHSLLATLIHELSHTRTFTPYNRQLDDIGCVNGRERSTAGDHDCLYDVAKGLDGLDKYGKPQGHKDAEAFALFVLTQWANSASWWRYDARDRTKDPDPQDAPPREVWP